MRAMLGNGGLLQDIWIYTSELGVTHLCFAHREMLYLLSMLFSIFRCL